ncbi:putative pumilio homolog 8, chloroplastic, partial [Tanacetum coccineum]
SMIIRELLSATLFEQVLQDPQANYVVQTALRVAEVDLQITCDLPQITCDFTSNHM